MSGSLAFAHPLSPLSRVSCSTSAQANSSYHTSPRRSIGTYGSSPGKVFCPLSTLLLLSSLDTTLDLHFWELATSQCWVWSLAYSRSLIMRLTHSRCSNASCCHYYECLMTNLDAYHSSWHIRDRTQSSLFRKDPNCLCLCLSTGSILRSDFHPNPGCGCCCFYTVLPLLNPPPPPSPPHLLPVPRCDAGTRPPRSTSWPLGPS